MTSPLIVSHLHKNTPQVISFETMIDEFLTKEFVWNNYPYSEENRKEKRKRYHRQIDKHSDKPFYRSVL